MEQYTFVRLHAREGEESAVEEALREVTGPTREEAGCVSFHTFRSMRDRRLFYIHSRWVDGSRIPSPRGIAAYGAIPRTCGCAARSAARCREDGDDWVNRRAGGEVPETACI